VGRREAGRVLLDPRPHGGFSLTELLLAMALMLIVTGAVFAVLNPAEGRFATELEAVDMDQRLRVAADTLTRDLLLAGAGIDSGSRPGPLNGWFPAILPFRRGAVNDDVAGTFRRDAVTLLYVPAGAAQSTLAAAVGPGQHTLRVDQHTGCPSASPLCGFSAGMTVLVFDATGSFDTFTLTSVTGAAGELRANRPGGTLSTTYRAGSQVAEAIQRTYYLKTDRSADSYQLMRYDGSTNAGAPVVDHVVGLEFEYFADPHPPTLLKTVTEPNGLWTTYGPAPPPPDVEQRPFAAGENCIFTIDPRSGMHRPRMGSLRGGALVPMGAGELADGDVWCPHGSDPRRYDADLLRIRAVVAMVRIQSASAAFRGPAGVLFRNGGISGNAHRFLPDREIRVRISPRNLAASG
jgi:prepilin-type N-terminal cleavage/methylation domain-containing protein